MTDLHYRIGVKQGAKHRITRIKAARKATQGPARILLSNGQSIAIAREICERNYKYINRSIGRRAQGVKRPDPRSARRDRALGAKKASDRHTRNLQAQVKLARLRADREFLRSESTLSNRKRKKYRSAIVKIEAKIADLEFKIGL